MRSTEKRAWAKSFGKWSAALALAMGSKMAHAQSFNIDLDVFFGGPQVGEGAPSSSFGGAANQPGVWNQIHLSSPGPDPVRDLQGNSTSIVMSIPTGSGIGGGSGSQTNSGDYRALLNDYSRIPDQMLFRFNGLTVGHYRVYTYAIDAGGATRIAEIRVNGSAPQLSGQGPMPGNAFALGVTHCVNEAFVANGVLEIEARNFVQGPPNASVNGFQIIAVPEPSSAIAAVLALSIYGLRRRKSSANCR